MKDAVVDDLIRLARRCRRAAESFHDEKLEQCIRTLQEAAYSVGLAWSGSWLGYQASVYLRALRPRRHDEHFDVAWGLRRYPSASAGDWHIFSYDDILCEIRKRAAGASTDGVERAASDARRVFSEVKEELLPILDAVCADSSDKTISELRTQAESLPHYMSRVGFIEVQMPRQILSHDSRALQEGIQTPPHLAFGAWMLEQASYGIQVGKLGELAMRGARYLQNIRKLKGKSVGKTDGAVFIGHGRSSVWKDLREFLRERLKLEVIEFNSTPVAGKSTKERLLETLERCCFAFLVMTADDEHADGSKHARLNVAHEIGLFQGRYGFERAIILLEEGCEEFSNVFGVGQIRFPPGKLMAASEAVREVLEREAIL